MSESEGGEEASRCGEHIPGPDSGGMRGAAAPGRATRDVICVQGTQESRPQFPPTLKF